MTLTADDVRRISSLGRRDFYMEMEDGYLQLRNRDGHCIFLEGGHCVIYDHRPEGCTLYPMIVDVEDWTVIMHDYCLHRDEFRFTEKQEDQLLRLIEVQDDEKRSRSAVR
jgi:Fe-S-cluster containining protein